MTVARDPEEDDPRAFWEERYRSGSPRSSGKPGRMLKRFVEPLPPGRALELGCGRGDDAVWLARRGWTVVAVDISATALGYAADNAARAGVLERMVFEQHDLARSFPRGPFDLVTASFLPAKPREDVLRRAAATVAPGGHVFIVDHASRMPWSTSKAARHYPSPEETFAMLAPDEAAWSRVHVEAIERKATGPDGRTARVTDNVVFVARR